MDLRVERIAYPNTNSFSRLVNDYVSGAATLSPFFKFSPTMEGFKASIEQRKNHQPNREVLIEALKEQYAGYSLTPAQTANLDALANKSTFTITTAHQPNIFTGPLYFIYKILHAIKLAAHLKQELPQYNFFPIYYMGSEDADLDELGHFYVEGEKISWNTDQAGAVGRMNTKGLEKIINRLEGQFSHLAFGKEMVAICKKAYLQHSNIQDATLYLVNELFKQFGLLVIIPDNAKLKRLFVPVVQKELVEGFSQPLVLETAAAFSQHYKVQTEGRPINLFYLDENGRRERIEKIGDRYEVTALNLSFSQQEILQLASDRPELFSANVILRGVFQETILPNIAFIGGGGELAYWMELKTVFEACDVPYPVLVLRNSFALLNQRQQQWKQKAGLTVEEMFQDEIALLNAQVARKHGAPIHLQNFESTFFLQFEQLQKMAADIDATLQPHVAAIHTQVIKKLKGLEKKMQRAARRQLDEEGNAISRIKETLFPKGGLQERQENFLPLFAVYGHELIAALLEESPSFEPLFTIAELP
jgi:bacillithiol biosynthesis cysteine-adding enzyme BshC